ncbi:peptide ABC transporter substrate-binding protein [Sansalvadorimonas sp. 2012CJ34-2]|uniref:Peptide ABC transporter substrate-binding protein n=1 Tax=Parendozoicomonas callyspongiae TaxID=2942213 RepID=A0ABT0PHN8_9GAMM|nr:peptide ABC transporter substrate-binding protein [Sansalvadorimonas sp. 2012CJ34-2]MCL6270904.1 peptide ABC transporter substrate-binding protein [Sansalvadorimonas sp. 2012CJ34-2]
MKKLFVGLALATAVSALLPVQAAQVPAGVTLAKEQVFHRGIGSEPASIDPQKVEGSPGGFIVKDLFEGLVSQDADGNTIPGIAKSWNVSDDGKVYTFHLRKSSWSNGDPLTAHDFVYAFQRAVDPVTASKYAWFMQIPGIVNADAVIDGEMPPSTLGVKATDDYTFQVTLENPVPYFPKLLAHYTTFPTPKKVVEKYGDDWTRPDNIVSNGAYKLSGWVVNEKLTAKRNPFYWNNDKTVVEEVNYLPIPSATSELNRYKAGELDMTATIPLDHFKKLQKEIPKEVTITPLISTYYYSFNTKKKPFDDVRVRKALSYAINRDAITKYITGQGQKPAYSFTPSSINGFVKPDLAWEKMSQKEREKEAAKLLKQVGYSKSNPLKVELLYNTSESHKKVAIAISQMWKQALGVEVTLRNEEWKTFLDTRREGNFDVTRAGWTGDYNEASTMLSLWTSESSLNDAKWTNKEYDKLLETASSTIDEGKRGLIYEKAEQIFSSEMPAAPIYQYVTSRLVKPYVGGYPMNNPEDNVYSRDIYIIKH